MPHPAPRRAPGLAGPLARYEFLNVVVSVARERGTTVLLSSHIVSDVEAACDHLIVLGRSREATSVTLRSVVLTWKMHRFEVVFCAVVLALVAASLWYVSSQMLDLDIPARCWPRDEEGDHASAECDELMGRYDDVRHGQAGSLRVGLSVVAPILGLILGVPIVARELEVRTTSLVWSLSLRRSPGSWPASSPCSRSRSSPSSSSTGSAHASARPSRSAGARPTSQRWPRMA